MVVYLFPMQIIVEAPVNLLQSGGTQTVTINVNPLPTITLGANPSVCSGTTVAALPFTAVTNVPNKYSIVYSAEAITAGLVNVTDAIFPASSPINLVVPAGITTGTYNGSISVSNANNCGSTSQPFTILAVHKR